MAGSFEHCLTDEKTYRGVGLLENIKDMAEAVEEMAFMLLHIKHRRPDLVADADYQYYKCLRREQPWPDFMKPGIEDQTRLRAVGVEDKE